MMRAAATLLILLLISSTGIAQELTPDQWRQDLNYLAKELPKRHKNAFHTVTRERFDAAVHELDLAIPNLQSHEVVVGMMRLVAMVGDAHTELSGVGDNFRRFPLNVYWFANELRVTRIASRYKEAAGAKVIKIGETGVIEANARLAQLAPHENTYWLRLLSASFAPYAEILHALKLIPDLQHGSWTFEDDSGKQFTLQLETIKTGDPVEWISASPQLPLYRQKSDEQFWSTYLRDSQTVYVNFRGYRDKFDEHAQELLNLVKEKSPQRLRH
jgi:hypothetical protein